MLVSVLINNYNYANYLEECIVSVLNQTYKNIEIIVYDDGSTDHSLDVLSKFNNIKVISNKNYGKSHSFNQMNAVYQAYLQSKGEYIFLLDSDDSFKVDKIEKVLNVFKEYPKVGAVQHLLEEVDSFSHPLNSVVPILIDVSNYKEYIYSTGNLFHLFSTTSALAFRSSFLQRVMPLNEDAYSYICVDTRLMQLAAIYSEIFTLGEPLTYYRKHDANDSKKYGDINIYRQFTSELYDFFNSISVTHGYEAIRYSHTNFLENTLFFKDINIDKCNQFISNNKYWIWGAGEAGQSVCHALREKKGELMGFIDSDPRKHGHMIMERKIYAPENIDYNKNIKIIVSPYHSYDAIKNSLQPRHLTEGIQFIDPYMRRD